MKSATKRLVLFFKSLAFVLVAVLAGVLCRGARQFMARIDSPRFREQVVRGVAPVQKKIRVLRSTVVPGRVGPQPELLLTPEELVVKRRVDAMLAERQPTHQVVFDGFKKIEGQLVEEHPGHIVFLEQYGETGFMQVPIPRERIVRMETLNATLPDVTARVLRCGIAPESRRLLGCRIL